MNFELPWLLASGIALWADVDVFRSLGSGFRGRRAQITSNDLWAFAAIVAACAGAALIFSRYISRQERAGRHHHPRALFRKLCQAHDLTWTERRLLLKLSQAHGLAHPGRLFIEPERFTISSLSPELARQADLVEELRERLFGDWIDPTPEQSSSAQPRD